MGWLGAWVRLRFETQTQCKPNVLSYFPYKQNEGKSFQFNKEGSLQQTSGITTATLGQNFDQ